VHENSIINGKLLIELEKITGADILVMGLIQGEQRLPDPYNHLILHPCDVLIIRSDTRDLQTLLDSAGLELVGSRKIREEDLPIGQSRHCRSRDHGQFSHGRKISPRPEIASELWGYKFGDYWRMGLPLGIVVTAVAIPLILLVWPF